MDTSKTYIKMCACEEIQELLDKGENGNYIYRKFISNRPHATAIRECSCVDITGHPDFYWLNKYGNGEPAGQWVSWYHYSDSPDYYGTDVVWLPRQDQLQEMVDLPYLVKFECQHERIIGELIVFGSDKHSKVFMVSGKSMEQLWLAFVMKEKYNKTWDGEKWNSR